MIRESPRLQAGENVKDLFEALVIHYRGEVDRQTLWDQMLRILKDSSCELVMALRDQQPVGLATMAVFPGTATGSVMFLKDLFVVESERGSGIGRQILGFLAQVAVERGCCRVDWTTEDWNQGAIRFYERLGAQQVETKIFYRLEGEALRSASTGQSHTAHGQ